MRRCAVFGCVLVALTLCLPQPVAAQNDRAEVSVGYSFLSNDSLAVNASKLPLGFFFGGAWQVSDNLGLAFDLNGHFNRGVEASSSLAGVVAPLPTEDFQAFSFNRSETGWCSPRITACEVHTQAVSMVAGPRLSFPAGGVRPFVHIMAGVTRSLRKIVFFAHSATNLTIQPGGGVDIDMTENTAFRFQGDYRRVFFGEPDQANPTSSLVSTGGVDYSDFTFSVGVVFRLGQR